MKIDWRLMGSTAVSCLTDSEFRAFLVLASYVSYWRNDVSPDGTFPTDWHTFAHYSRPGRRRVGRVTKRHIERFIAVGLLEDFVEDDTGDEYLRFRDWRSWVSPDDPTAAERAARWRERHGMYGRRKRRAGDPPAFREIAPHELGHGVL